MLNQFLLFCALTVATAAGLYIFRDGFGLVVFILVGLATLVQLIRVIAGFGRTGTLKTWWSALKDAFWGMG
jgi:hypothetical protein